MILTGALFKEKVGGWIIRRGGGVVYVRGKRPRGGFEMAKLTIQDAEKIAGRSRPWTFRLEFIGSNPVNASGRSEKYWYATGRGLNEAVEIGWGRIGNKPQHQLIDWPELRSRVADKLGNDYEYADTNYVRMSAASLATLGGTTPSAPAAAPQTPPQPKPVATPPTPTSAPTQGAQTAKYTKQPSQDQLDLGEPYSLIRALRFKRDAAGTTITGFAALDEDGDVLLDLSEADGQDFIAKYDPEVVFG